MPPHPFVPETLRRRPFHQSEAISFGVTPDMLNGPIWTRVLPRVWAHRDHEMSDLDWITASSLAMSPRAQLSHLSRIQALGLDVGAVRPVRFTVSGDLHIHMPGVFLHRTEVLPPLDAIGVTPAAAFIQYCATARLIDAIKVGDWLLHHRHMTTIEVGEVARAQQWRPGARQSRRVLPLLDGGSRSLKESEVRSCVVAAGLPRPETNIEVVVDGELLGIVDLLIRCVMLALEYEGRQHAESIAQFNRDIHRYAAFRRHTIDYLQVTSEMLGRPKVMIMRIHTRMLELGYVGPAPVFGDRWDELFLPIRAGRWPSRPSEAGWATDSPLPRG
ncbi:hypothetical protein C6I20_13225 [Aeromicrobium sp. A1-2]|uniref:hypothetical protein n=1 Tax=Aeromicrobium sp. A1-2 TaxID=2107713 RepID=UPI000E4DF20B|nr:hypothetical protein [Aeromicrobium sp. A1-2]AXT86051.1 hypothetical protein C6I20_13225 [Aeromicrobium sp. A1-2]